LLGLLNDLLDFSKIEAGHVSLEKIPFDPCDLVRQVLRSFAAQAAQKNLVLTFDFSPGMPGEVFGDPVKLRQVLVNLVGNALKFTHQGHVAVYAAASWSEQQKIEIEFEVEDTGIGIPLEKQDVIFQAFAQADGSMTRRYGGTGLGLSISTRLAEAMGGGIWLESEAGKGSTFHFTAEFDTAPAGLSPGDSQAAPDEARALC
jgi:signal transduction histidine kinase